jgi:hypothetical protein
LFRDSPSVFVSAPAELIHGDQEHAMPPSDTPHRPLPQSITQLLRVESYAEIMQKGPEPLIDQLETALNALARIREIYEYTDEEWSQYMRQYRQAEFIRSFLPLADRYKNLRTCPPNLPARLQPPPPGSSVDEYQAYVDRMRPYYLKAGKTSAVELLEDMMIHLRASENPDADQV